MKTMLTIAAALATLLSLAAGAQQPQWTHYVPPEGDFRVLLPAPPERLPAAQGSVEFRAKAGSLEYSVFRHDPKRLAGASIRENVITRITGSDQNARSFGDDEGELKPNEFHFMVASVWSIHRVITESGRYYELAIRSDSQDAVTLQAARDFFDSFQLGSGIASSFPALSNLPGPDSCQTRGNTLSRRFCEYLTCLVPANQAHPVCASLPKPFR